MKQLLRPRTLIPVIVGVALIGALLTFGNARAILDAAAGFDPRAILWYLALLLVYEAARGAQWLYLLHAQGGGVRRQTVLLSFLGGEVTKSLPLGNFFPNYLLRQAAGADFGRTSAVSMVIIVFEIVLALAGVVLLGLGAWTPWLRVGMAGVVIALGVAGWALYHLRGTMALPPWLMRLRGVRVALAELRQFRAGAADVMRLRVLLVTALLSATYILAAAAQLYVIILSLGLSGVSFRQAVAVYCLILAVTLLAPLPVDLGVTEVSGVGALMLVGLASAPAITVMLLSRVLSVGLTLLVAGLGLACLYREVRALLRARTRARVPSQPASQGRIVEGSEAHSRA